MNATISNFHRQDAQKVLSNTFNFPTNVLGYKIRKFNEQVMGFMGNYFKLTIMYSPTNTEKKEKISYFVKTLPVSNKNQENYVKESGIFVKEVRLYKNLLCDLLKLASFGPQCYHIIGEEILVLENLSDKGYKNLPKNSFNFVHISTMLTTLAEYHATSLIYEEQNGIKIGIKFVEEIKETSYSFTEGDPRQKWLINVTKCVCDLIKMVQGSEDTCNKFTKFATNEIKAFLNPSHYFRNSLSHDDLWCNNAMFNEEGKCKMVDFQMARYTPPAFDFYVTVLLNADEDMLQNQWICLIDTYFNAFNALLAKNKLDVNKVLPKSEFLECLDIYKLAALTEAVMYGTHVFIPQSLSNRIVADEIVLKEFSLTNRSKYACKEFIENQSFRRRLTTILNLLIETLDAK